MPATAAPLDDVIGKHDQFMSINYSRYPIVLERGHGAHLWDSHGKHYLDLFAGFGGPVLGHCHPDLIRAVNDQMHKLWQVGNLFHTEPQTRVAQTLHRIGFGGRSFFCHSGADANEAAIKLARLYGKAFPAKAAGTVEGRYKIVTALNSFHGRTFGAMMATGQDKVRKGFEPLLPGFNHVPFNDLTAVERAIDDQTVAVMVEPIQGEGGVNVPGDDYLPGLRKLCDDRDLLLICDEVWTGCGRTGRWFAHQHWNIAPDIMTLAKGVGGGLPVGVMCAAPRVAEHFDWHKYGGAIHGITLGGNCLTMAAAAAVLQVIEREGLIDHARKLGEYALRRLRRFAQDHPGLIVDVRGKGLFIGVELAPGPDAAKNIVNQCLERGLLINATQGVVLRLAPALVIAESELEEGLTILENVLLRK